MQEVDYNHPPAGWIPPIGASRKTWANVLKNKENIDYFLSICNSGSAVINNNCIQSGTNPHLPFGGTGASGMGRIGGYRGFEEMSNVRSVVHQPLDRFRNFLVNLPPYSKRYEGLIMSGIKK